MELEFVPLCYSRAPAEPEKVALEEVEKTLLKEKKISTC